jgi:hypothetical protein
VSPTRSAAVLSSTAPGGGPVRARHATHRPDGVNGSHKASREPGI